MNIEALSENVPEGSLPSRQMNYALWIVQALLAVVFLFAGSSKFIMSVEEMTRDIRLPGTFLRFIGAVEILGAIGLILPSLLRIRPGLTPLAAAGLVIIMIGAVVITFVGGVNVGLAVIPGVTGLLAAFVAWGRWRLAPIHPKR